MAAGAGIYHAVVEHDGISVLDQPAIAESIAVRTATNTQLLTWFTHLGGPPYEYTFSFHSGDALNSTVIAGMVAYLLVRRLRTPLARAAAAGQGG